MKNYPLFVCATVIGFLTGCSETRGIANSLYIIKPAFVNAPSIVYPVDENALDPDSQVPYPINLASYTLWGDRQPAVLHAASDASARNRLKHDLIRRSRLICGYTEAHIAGNADLVNFSLGETTTILGGLGALVTAATPARALSGAAGMVNATRGQVAANFYQNAVQYAILQKIDLIRASKLQDINNRDDDPISKYPVEAMLSDVQDYHNACSFYAGLENLPRDSDKITVPSVANQIAPIKEAISPGDQPNGGQTTQTKAAGKATTTADAWTKPRSLCFLGKRQHGTLLRAEEPDL